MDIKPNTATKHSKKDLENLAGMAAVLKDFQGLYAEMTALQMRVLIFVAMRGRCTGIEIAKGLNTLGSNVSRVVTVLSDIDVKRRKSAPLNLVELQTDPLDRRVRYVVLSERGKAVISAMTGHFKPN